MQNHHKLPRSQIKKVSYILHQDAIKEELEDQYVTYEKLKKNFSKKQIQKSSCILYSPGCGSDSLTTLLMIDALVDSSCKNITLVMQDNRDMFGGVLFLVKKFCSYPPIEIIHKKNRYIAKLQYLDKLIIIDYYIADFHKGIPIVLKDGFDLYYERAFELFRAESVESLRKLIIALNVKGYMITDAEFEFGQYEKAFRKVKGVPTNFGLYKNFQIWQKIKTIEK